ncbi:hypothetical protein ACJK5H_00080 (plasmid) [Enterococcus faecalis]|uniref:hypothetical protein n=1 Tax=Enterococcus faecalis TaxID=1351 RepID=UPI003D2740D5
MGLKKLLIGTVLLMLTFFAGSTVLATDMNNSKLFIKTHEVNPELIAHAQQDWRFYFENLTAVEDQGPLNIEAFYLGQPFTLTNETDSQTAYFPIIERQSGTINDILEVSLVDNMPALTISSQFVEQLNSLIRGIWNIETKMHGNDSSKHTQMLIYSLFSCFDFRDCRLLAGTLVRKCTVGSRTKIYIIKLHVKFTN